MSLLNIFYAVYPLLCFIAIVTAIASIIVPNDICDTTKTCKHVTVLFVISASLAGLSKLFILSIFIIGVFIAWKLYKVWKSKTYLVKKPQFIFIQHNEIEHFSLKKRVK